MTTSPSCSADRFSRPSWTWWRSLRSVSPAARSSSVSPTQRIGLQAGVERGGHLQRERLVGLAEVLAALGVAEHDAVDVELGEHRRRDLAGVGALGLVVHVLRVDLDARAARRVDHRLQRGERHADRDVGGRGRDARQQAGDEHLGLRLRLVHLPVARDQRRAVTHDSTSTPGSVLPSISSSDAPPPVDRCVTSSSSPNCFSAAALSPPPTTVVPSQATTASATAARAGRERRQLERAHRAVPEDGPGAGDDLGVGLRGLRADVEAHPAVGNVDAVDQLRLGVRAERAARDEVDRQMQLALAVGEHAPRGLDALLLAQRVADLVALRREEREHIAPPIRIASAISRNASSTPILSVTLAPPTIATSGRCGVVEDALQRLDLALEQEPGRARQQLRDAVRRGVRAVRGAERVVDVDVAERGVARGERRGRPSSRPRSSGRSRASRRRRRAAPRARRRAGRRRRAARRAAPRPGASENSGSRSFGRPRWASSTSRARRARAARAASAARPGCARRR